MPFGFWENLKSSENSKFWHFKISTKSSFLFCSWFSGVIYVFATFCSSSSSSSAGACPKCINMEEDGFTVDKKTGVVLCSLFATVLYLNTLSAEFAYDDNRAILRNPDVLQETPIADLFRNDFWGTPLVHSGSHKSYRPLCVLTFRLNHALHGLRPFGYHLINVLCHGSVTSLYVLVVDRISGNSGVALLSGILFGCHPIHTEAVAGIVGRAELLASLFFLFALLCCCRSCHHEPQNHECQHSSTSSWMSVLGIGLCSALSMLCKEQGLTVLAVCCVFRLFIQQRLQFKDIFNFHLVTKLFVMKDLLILCAFAILLLGFRILLMGGEPPEFAPADNPASESDSLLTRTLTYLYLPCLNFFLLLCPILLSFDWSMDTVPLVQSFTDLRVLVTFTFYVFLCIFVLYVLRFLNVTGSCGKAKEENDLHVVRNAGGLASCSVKFSHRLCHVPVVLMALTLAVIPFIPATNLFFYVGFVVAERVLYIPSMGFCLLVAQGFYRLLSVVQTLSRGRIYQQLLWMLFFLLVVSFSVRTWRRNLDWRTEDSLYRSGLYINPAKAYGNLGNVLKAQGKMNEAEMAYRSALRYRSNMADVHYNLGLYYQEKKRYDESILSYLKAIECRPKLTVAFLNLGLVYNAVGLKAEAETLFRKCYDIDISGLKDPRLHEQTKASALYNLGRLLADDGRNLEAIEIYKTCLDTAPSDFPLHSVYNMLGESYFRIDDLSQAELNYRHALQLKPDHIPAYLTLAKLHQAKNELDMSEDWLKKALELNPMDISIHRHYGQFLSEAGRQSEAADWLLKAVASDPDDFETVFNCANALRQSGRVTEAEEFYREAVRLKPSEVVAHMNLGAMLHFNRKFKEAEMVYLDALKMKPDDEIILANLRKLRNLMVQRHTGP